MAKKPHKFAWNGVDIDTALSASDLMSLCAQVAGGSNGSLFKTMHRLEETGRDDSGIAYVVTSALIRAFRLMTFDVEISAEGGRASLTTTIGTYTTSQYKVMYVIPLGPTEMDAHPTYMKFVRTVANTVIQADPTAKVRIREGKQGLEPMAPLESPRPAQPAQAVAAEYGLVSAVDVQTVGESESPFSQPEPITIFTPEPAATQIPAAPIAAQNEVSIPTLTLTVTSTSGESTKPESLPSAFQPSNVDGATTRTPRRARSQAEWTIELPDGRLLPVEAPIIFGRDPIGDGYVNAQLVAVPDSSRLVSKTHAVIQNANGRITVTDLHSANGSVIISAGGQERECESAVPVVVRAGASVELGGYAIKLLQAKANNK